MISLCLSAQAVRCIWSEWIAVHTSRVLLFIVGMHLFSFLLRKPLSLDLLKKVFHIC